MAITFDTDSKLAEYAHPEKLVTTDWLAEHLDDPGLVVVESDEDILLYETGHIPGAVKVDWHTELNDPVTRDYVDAEGFARLMRLQGDRPSDDGRLLRRQVQLVGCVRAVGVQPLRPPGPPPGRRRARQVGGGGQADDDRPSTRAGADYPVVERDDTGIRAFRDDVLGHLGKPLVDVRSPDEYSGKLLHMANYPQEGALRGGHIPGAKSVPWARAANEDGTFKSRAELDALYGGEVGLSSSDDVVVYCRIGERSSHTWFALTQLLGYERVRNYDGSWTEWGNSVRVPIEREEEPAS